MQPRSIVHDTLSDRFLIEGTHIFVAEIQRDYQANGDRIRAAYGRMGLSASEIDAALSFAFPAVRSARVAAKFIGLDICCECGEQRHTWVTGPTFETDACICGRQWRIPFGSEPVRGGGQSESPDGSRDDGATSEM